MAGQMLAHLRSGLLIILLERGIYFGKMVFQFKDLWQGPGFDSPLAHLFGRHRAAGHSYHERAEPQDATGVP
jgi:hypothetical protein